MDFIFELVFELLFEGGMEVTSNRKISKWVRYPLLALFALVFIGIIGLIIFMGISSLKNSIIGGIFIIGLGVFFLVASILKFRQFCIYEKSNLNNNQEKNDTN